VEATDVLPRDCDFERREGRGVAEMIVSISGETERSGAGGDGGDCVLVELEWDGKAICLGVSVVDGTIAVLGMGGNGSKGGEETGLPGRLRLRSICL
jgi:hypothetical protein